MSSDVLVVVSLFVAKFFLLVSFFLAFFRFLKGPTPFDRVVALDLIGGICLCMIVLFAIAFDQQVLLDAAAAIAFVSFIGTVAFARYLGSNIDS